MVFMLECNNAIWLSLLWDQMNEGAQWKDMLELGFFLSLIQGNYSVANCLTAEEEGGGVRHIPTLRTGI